MARLKEYRGDPEEKRYASFERFDGGLNTSFVDELVYENEFRELNNVELIKQGIVQNRKGFAEDSIFNQILEDSNITFFDGDNEYPLVSILKDTHNLFNYIQNAESVEALDNTLGSKPYQLHILIVKYDKVNENLGIHLLKIYNDAGIVAQVELIEDLNRYLNFWEESDYETYISNPTRGTSSSLPNPDNLTLPMFWRVTTPKTDFLGGLLSTGNDPLNLLQLTPLNDEEVAMLYVNTFGVVEIVDESITDTSDYSQVSAVYSPEVHTPNNEVLRLVGLNNTSYWWALPDVLNYFELDRNYISVNEYGKLVTMSVVMQDNKVYFPLYKLSESLDGFYEYNIEEETGRIISNVSNYYIPSPYEVSNVGFNLLSADPFEIKANTGAVPEIRNIFLTDASNELITLSKVPENEEFYLNVIYQGAVIPSDLTVEIYEEDAFGEKVILETDVVYVSNNAYQNLAVHRYLISGNFSNIARVFIKVYSSAEQPVNFLRSFDTLEDMVAVFAEKTPFVIATSNKYIDGYSYGADFYQPTLATIPGRLDYSVNTTLMENIPIKGRQPFTIYANSYKQIFNPTNGELELWYINSSGLIPARVLSGLDDPVDSQVNSFPREVSSFADVVPSYGRVYRIGTSPTFTYYTLKDLEIGASYEGTADDFVEVTAEFEETLNFTNVYEVGKEENREPIKPITLKNFKMIGFQNRLLLYGGNTMLFSDPFKFNYFPNYDYIVLSISPDDSIQNISYFRGSYIIFTKERIYRMSGAYGSEDFRIIMVSDAIGCVAPDSVRGINNTLIFMTNDGLYKLKQGFFMEDLENVDKVDKQIKDLIPYGTNYESLIYNEQYMLFLKDIKGVYTKTVKQYYNQEAVRGRNPYVTDVYSVIPDNLMKLGNKIYSIKDGLFYIYDRGYRDFGELYKYTLKTPNYALNYPEHDKKFKNIFLKTRSNLRHPIYITVYIDDNEFILPYEFTTTMTLDGIVYEKQFKNDTITGGITVLGTVEDGDPYVNMSLDEDALDGKEVIIHKIVVSGKGKDFAIKVEQMSDKRFSLNSIGVLHKLGKAKETR